MAAMKQKRMRTIKVNVVEWGFYEIFSTQKFIIQKFHYIKISKSTVV